jgi:hypothetical protein
MEWALAGGRIGGWISDRSTGVGLRSDLRLAPSPLLHMCIATADTVPVAVLKDASNVQCHVRWRRAVARCLVLDCIEGRATFRLCGYMCFGYCWWRTRSMVDASWLLGRAQAL